MKKNKYFRDTNVVILGDHLAMENPVYEKLEKLKERHVFNELIANNPPVKNREEVLHFDMFPTILEFIGFRVAGGKLGLGYTAISKEADMPPANEFEEMNEDLLNQSDEYLALWRKREIKANPN